MMQAMQGVLADDPQLQTLPGPDGRSFKVVSVNLYYNDGRIGSLDSRVRVFAWNEQADHLMQYKKGDEVQFIARLNATPSHNRSSADLSFSIQYIDDSRTLVPAMEQFLHNFEPAKEKLHNKIQRAEQQRQSNEQQHKGSELDIH